MSKKVPPGVMRVLRHIAAGRNPYSGVSGRGEHGALAGIVAAINRRGLVTWGAGDTPDTLTDAGRAALGERP